MVPKLHKYTLQNALAILQAHHLVTITENTYCFCIKTFGNSLENYSAVSIENLSAPFKTRFQKVPKTILYSYQNFCTFTIWQTFLGTKQGTLTAYFGIHRFVICSYFAFLLQRSLVADLLVQFSSMVT